MSVFLPQITMDEVGDSIVVKDTSGNFDPQNNPGGYGVQNIIPQWVTYAWLYVTPSRTNVPNTYQINVFGVMGAPNTAYQVLPHDLNMEHIESELYTIRYVVGGTKPDGTTFEYETTCDYVTLHLAQCCVDKMSGTTYNTKFDSVFRDEQSRKEALLSVLMRRATEARACGNYEAADRQVYYVRMNCNCNCDTP